VSEKVALSKEQLFEDSAVVNFFEHMRAAVHLRDAIREARDAALRGTDGMPEDIIAGRITIMEVAADLLVIRINEYVSDARRWLND